MNITNEGNNTSQESHKRPLTMESFTTIKKLLNYSFNDINWEYSKLTITEKTLVTENEFNKLKLTFK